MMCKVYGASREKSHAKLTILFRHIQYSIIIVLYIHTQQVTTKTSQDENENLISVKDNFFFLCVRSYIRNLNEFIFIIINI
jgi:hypothetical protein